MKLHILGAAQTVTGSMFLLEFGKHKLLLDCGMFQGKRDETYAVK
jgi:metallo-beta-lactamase family protein